MSTSFIGKTYTFESVAFSGKMLNLFGIAASGNNVGLLYWDGSLAQQWRVSVDNGYKLECMKNPNFVLDRYDSSGSYCNNADVWADSTQYNDEQQIAISVMIDGTVKISQSVFDSNNNYTGELYLTAVSNANGSPGGKTPTSDGNVYWATETNSATQRWRMTEVIEGTHTVQNGVDTIAKMTQARLNALENNGEHPAFFARYYCSNEASTKLLKAEEAELLSSNGYEIISVYQDRNDRDTDFSSDWYDSDSNGAYAAATNAGQPEGTPIYFAVDYDPSESSVGNYIIPYFQAIKQRLSAKPVKYKIGVYGSGLVCRTIKQELGLADYSWLAMSTAYNGTAAYDDPRLYDIKQTVGVSINNVNYDRDVTGRKSDFGQWSL